MSCIVTKYVNFTVSFYSDSNLTQNIINLETENYYQYFTVNGSPITAEGAPLCKSQCANIVFTLPQSAPLNLLSLYNTPLYAEVTAIRTNLIGGTGQTQTIFIVDESVNSGFIHDVLPTIITSLNTQYEISGISLNQFALIGFGSQLNLNSPRLFRFNVAGYSEPFADANTIANFISNDNLAVSNGSGTDGYWAIDYGCQMLNASLNVGAALQFILITDEDRSNLSSLTSANIIADMASRNANLNVIVPAFFESNTNQPAFGISSTSVYVETLSSYEVQNGGKVSYSLGNVNNNYIVPALTTKGTAWDVSLISNSAWISAFVDTIATNNEQILACLTTDDFPVETFFCLQTNPPAQIIIPTKNIPLGCIHARISFFGDANRQELVYSAFSLYDQRRWYIQNTPLCPLTQYGLLLTTKNAPNLIYTPEILPASLIENQDSHELNYTDSEMPLLCGAQYYVTVDLLYAGEEKFIRLAEYEYIFPCANNTVNLNRQNQDAQNWTSSGQGKQDTAITTSSNQCLFPSVSANWSGNFLIAWQDFRNTPVADNILDFTSQIYFGVWDTVNNRIWTSGPGNYDNRMFSYGFRPKVTCDTNGTFYTAARIDNNLEVFGGPVIPATTSSSSYYLTDNISVSEASETLTPDLYLKARVFEADITGSFVIDKNTVISIVNDCIVRLEIQGISGVYAVRMRNENQSSWSDWLNVDQKRLDKVVGTNAYPNLVDDNYMSAYLIDNERLVVPWILSAGNGVKQVNIQVLTYYGVSQTIELDILSNIAELDYSLQFFQDTEMTKPYPLFNGYPAVKAGTNPTIKITFSDPTRLNLYLNTISQLDQFKSFSGLSFNVVQQGINIQLNLPLTLVSTGIYSGTVPVFQQDGVFNQDGLAAVVVNIPNPCTVNVTSPCGSDSTDPYNLLTLRNLHDFYVKYENNIGNLNPQELMVLYRNSNLSRPVNTTSLNQFYNVDDPRFVFGNPAFL